MKDTNKYNCQMALDHLIGELEHNPSDAILEELIQTYPECESTLKHSYEAWKELENIEVPIPSVNMSANFYKELSAYDHPVESNKEATVRSIDKFGVRNWMKYAAAILLLTSGIFIGLQINQKEPSIMADLQNELTDQMNDEIYHNVIAINDISSASNRLDGIQKVKQINHPNQKIFEALNQALLHDKNISVRLSAIETMLHFADVPVVREYLIKAIPHQDSPIVQVALADAMLGLHESSAAESIQNLIETGKLELEVKDHLEKTIKELM